MYAWEKQSVHHYLTRECLGLGLMLQYVSERAAEDKMTIYSANQDREKNSCIWIIYMIKWGFSTEI